MTQWYQGRIQRDKATPVAVASSKTVSISMNLEKLEATPWKVSDLKRSAFSKSGKHVKTDLRWKKPSDTGTAKLMGYQVTVKAGSKIVSQSTVDTVSASVKKLKKGTTYTVEVRAKNKYGFGVAQVLTMKTPKG